MKSPGAILLALIVAYLLLVFVRLAHALTQWGWAWGSG